MKLYHVYKLVSIVLGTLSALFFVMFIALTGEPAPGHEPIPFLTLFGLEMVNIFAGFGLAWCATKLSSKANRMWTKDQKRLGLK